MCDIKDICIIEWIHKKNNSDSNEISNIVTASKRETNDVNEDGNQLELISVHSSNRTITTN